MCAGVHGEPGLEFEDALLSGCAVGAAEVLLWEGWLCSVYHLDEIPGIFAEDLQPSLHSCLYYCGCPQGTLLRPYSRVLLLTLWSLLMQINA